MSAATLCWTDIPVTNLDRAITFYSDVLRQEVRKMSEGGLEYGLLPHEEQNASGCLCVGGDSVGDKNQPSQNGPLIYLSVEGQLGQAFKLPSQTVEKCCGRNSRSGRPHFGPSYSIQKEIASHSIHPRCKVPPWETHETSRTPRKLLRRNNTRANSPRRNKQWPKGPVIKATEPAKPAQKLDPTQLEKSLAVLAKLREMEFHSRANIEKLAELSLTIEDELKQKAFAEPIGALYSAQDVFHSKISKLIEACQVECERLKPAG
jgi:hypothetical protein